MALNPAQLQILKADILADQILAAYAVQTITVSSTAPGSPALNDLWLEI